MATCSILAFLAVCLLFNSVPSSLSSSTPSPEADLKSLPRNDVAQQVKQLRIQLATLEHELERPKDSGKPQAGSSLQWLDGPVKPMVRYENLPERYVMDDPDTLSDDNQRTVEENFVRYHPRATGWQPVRRMVGFQPMKRGAKSMVGWQPVKRDYQQRMVGFQPMKRGGESEQEYYVNPRMVPDPLGKRRYRRYSTEASSSESEISVGWQPVRRSAETPRLDERMVGWQPVRSAPGAPLDYDGEQGNPNEIEREVLNAIEGHMKSDLNAIQQRYGIHPELILKDLRAKHSETGGT